MNSISTHVLDTSLGQPAEGVAVTLEQFVKHGFRVIGAGSTDKDGRLKTLLEGKPLENGAYRIAFDVQSYFEKQNRKSFYPSIQITFTVTDSSAHYHVPLLVSPYGYTTYRGS